MAGDNYDLFVIGAGSGGVRAARIASGHGARVALAEADRFGGTCVIRGCVPKKLLVYASRFADDFEDARGFGWTLDAAPRFDWSALIAAKDKEIARLEGLYRQTLTNAGVTTFAERAEIASPTSIRLASGREISADKILIATGGSPYVEPELVGREHVITSDQAFHLASLPEEIVIVGGGYIAVEFAGIFAGLGARTTLLYRGDKILRGFDADLREGLSEAYAKRGIRIVTGRNFTRIEKRADGRLVGHLDDGGTLTADQIMYATGRRPKVAGIGLEALGVECGWNGHVVVDDEFRSSVPTIFAVGDVTDHPQLTPVAIRDGHAFADRMFAGKTRDIDYENIPTAVFSTPEIGTVGLPEHLAAERTHAYDVYLARFRPMRATISGRDERTIMKLIVDIESDRVIGCHVLGPDAGEMVQIAAIAMRLGATKAQFDATMPLHPSAAEELVTMRTKRPPPATP